MSAPTAARVKGALQAGAIGSWLMAAGWSVALLALLIALATGHSDSVADLALSSVPLGLVALALWIAGSITQTPGWLALRLLRGGHARAVALLAMIIGAALLLGPLLAMWGLPLLWMPTVIAWSAWHLVAASWFARADGDRAACVAHGVAALGIALTMLAGYYRWVALLTVAVVLAALAAIVAYLLTARYMSRARPFAELVRTFE